MADYAESEIVRDLAQASAAPARVEAGQHYVWRGREGELVKLDLTGEMPPRRTGTVKVRNVAAFAAYFGKHADEGSEVFGDLDAATVTAVLDAHRGSDHDDGEVDASARWQAHRVVLALKTTQAWDTWLEHDRAMRPQKAFAEFLEDNYRDLAAVDAYPAGIPAVRAADFMELAQHFTASTKTEFVSGQRLSSGEIEIVLSTQTTAAGGGKQLKVEIPEQFAVAIAPYEDCGRSVIEARFRYDTSGGVLKLGYFLNQPERVREDAVREIAEQVANETERDVWLGVAP